jgi:hypothetical protein
MSEKQQPITALARAVPQQLEPWRNVDFQRLWLSLLAKPWSTLALVPASRGVAPDFTLRLATTLARTGNTHLRSSVLVADGTGVALSKIIEFTDEIKNCRAGGDRILIAVAPVEDDPVAETLTQAADRLLLCVLFETMSFSESRRTVKKIGKDRFIGSVIVRSEELASGEK